jgi:hypothetical protein
MKDYSKNASITILFLLLIFGINFAANETKIGVYVINAGKFDPQSGTYNVDFYLNMNCINNCSSEFEFTNGRATNIDKIVDLPNEKFYRIVATLQDPVDFRKFPFDSHTLSISLEDKFRTTESMIYTADLEKSGVEKEVQFVGWQLKNWSAKTTEHYYRPYDETYSRYQFNINLEREALSSILKIFVPVLFIMLLNFFAHFPDPDKITTRITMHSSFLIAAVMFHVAIGNQLPALGYLTVADKFMFASYLSLAFSLFSAIVILELTEEKKTELVGKIQKGSGIASFIIWIIGLLFVFLTM